MQRDSIKMMNKNNISILNQFGNRVQSIRKSANLSQENLAELCGLHRTYIGMIERGEKNITLKNIEKLSIALNVNVADLLKDLNG